MSDSTEKPTRVPIRPKKTPRIRVNGEPDKRILNKGIPKGEKARDARITLRLTQENRDWLDTLEGRTGLTPADWLDQKIGQERGDSPL